MYAICCLCLPCAVSSYQNVESIQSDFRIFHGLVLDFSPLVDQACRYGPGYTNVFEPTQQTATNTPHGPSKPLTRTLIYPQRGNKPLLSASSPNNSKASNNFLRICRNRNRLPERCSKKSIQQRQCLEAMSIFGMLDLFSGFLLSAPSRSQHYSHGWASKRVDVSN